MTRKKYILLALVGLGALYVIQFTLPKLIIEPNHPITNAARYVFSSPIQSKNWTSAGRKISVLTKDGFKLVGRYSESLIAAKGSILLVHGIRSSKEDFEGIVPILTQAGYNTLAVDLRAHGASQGKYCTFGAKEKEDLKLFMDHLPNHLPKGIWGRSLGGAISLHMLAENKDLTFGIVESTFSDFDQITRDYFKRLSGFTFPLLMNVANKRAAKIGEFKLKDVVPQNACSQIEQNILMSHGNQDKSIAMKYGKENFEELKTKNKQFEIVEGAGHNNIWSLGGQEYFNKVIGFLDSSSKGAHQ